MKEQQKKRMKACNLLLIEIATHGHKFYSSGDKISYFAEIHNKLYFIDAYWLKPMQCKGNHTAWAYFERCGGVWSFIRLLARYIRTGEELYDVFDSSWDYGKDIVIVRALALKLGIIKKGVKKS